MRKLLLFLFFSTYILPVASQNIIYLNTAVDDDFLIIREALNFNNGDFLVVADKRIYLSDGSVFHHGNYAGTNLYRYEPNGNLVWALENIPLYTDHTQQGILINSDDSIIITYDSSGLWHDCGGSNLDHTPNVMHVASNGTTTSNRFDMNNYSYLLTDYYYNPIHDEYFPYNPYCVGRVLEPLKINTNEYYSLVISRAYPFFSNTSSGQFRKSIMKHDINGLVLEEPYSLPDDLVIGNQYNLDMFFDSSTNLITIIHDHYPNNTLAYTKIDPVNNQVVDTYEFSNLMSNYTLGYYSNNRIKTKILNDGTLLVNHFYRDANNITHQYISNIDITLNTILSTHEINVLDYSNTNCNHTKADISFTQDSIYLTTTHEDVSTQETNAQLYKIDLNGNIIESHILDHQENENAQGFQVNDTNDFIVWGYVDCAINYPDTNNYGSNSSFIIFGKTNNLSTDDFNLQNEITVYPNPFNEELTIQQNGSSSLTITINSLDGKKIVEEKLNGKISKINLQDLSSGLYICRIQNENGAILHKKIVKE